MESFITAEMLSGLTEGEAPKFIGYLLVYLFLRIELKGIKKELAAIGAAIGVRLDKGERRFDNLENDVKDLKQQMKNLKPLEV